MSAPDLMIPDVPYEQQTARIETDDVASSDRVAQLSEALGSVLRPDAVEAICASGR